MVRKPEMISLDELAAAVVVALQQNLALSRSDLVKETARLIGFARTGKDVAAALERAIDVGLADRLEVDHLNRLKLKDE